MASTHPTSPERAGLQGDVSVVRLEHRLPSAGGRGWVGKEVYCWADAAPRTRLCHRATAGLPLLGAGIDEDPEALLPFIEPAKFLAAVRAKKKQQAKNLVTV